MKKVSSESVIKYIRRRTHKKHFLEEKIRMREAGERYQERDYILK